MSELSPKLNPQPIKCSSGSRTPTLLQGGDGHPIQAFCKGIPILSAKPPTLDLLDLQLGRSKAKAKLLIFSSAKPQRTLQTESATMFNGSSLETPYRSAYFSP